MYESTQPPLRLAPRDPRAHKGRCGTVVIIAGSHRYAGAAALAAEGAARAGAGMVVLLVPEAIVGRVSSGSPQRIVIGVAESRDGGIAFPALAACREAVSAADAVVFGPGCRVSDARFALLTRLEKERTAPMVIDADGLNMLAACRATAGLSRPETCILLPHPGEAARLLETDVATVEADRPAAVRALREKLGGAVVVLKGAGTLIAHSGGLEINRTGNPGLATGGSGDVLSGVVGALLAQGLSPADAARLGVWAHGRAADLLAHERPFGYSPAEVAAAVPTALAEAIS